MTVQLLYVRGCPHLDVTRERVRRCLSALDLNLTVEEREGDHPSPSVIIDGVDVMGAPTTEVASCRLDLPTEERILEALRRGTVRTA